MNKIWFIITIVSIIFGILNNKTSDMINSLFDVPENVINNLLKIGSMLIIYNGLFNIAINSKCISKLAKLLNKRVTKIFKLEDNKLDNIEIIELISTSIICNMLGLGPANMPIAIKLVDKLRYVKYSKYNLTMYLFINISSFCILPLSLLTLRSTFKSLFNIEFVVLIMIASFITTVFSVFLCKLIYKGDKLE